MRLITEGEHRRKINFVQTVLWVQPVIGDPWVLWNYRSALLDEKDLPRHVVGSAASVDNSKNEAVDFSRHPDPGVPS